MNSFPDLARCTSLLFHFTFILVIIIVFTLPKVRPKPANRKQKRKENPAKPKKIPSRTRKSLKTVDYRWHKQELNVTADEWISDFDC